VRNLIARVWDHAYICIIISVELFNVQGSGLKRPNPAAKRDQQNETTLIGANVMFHLTDKRGESESRLQRHE
jgi:hypothetical protein